MPPCLVPGLRLVSRVLHDLVQECILSGMLSVSGRTVLHLGGSVYVLDKSIDKIVYDGVRAVGVQCGSECFKGKQVHA